MKLTTITFGLSILAIGIAFLLAIFLVPEDGGQLILHFVTGMGIDMYGARSDLFSLLYAGLGLIGINIIAAGAFYKREHVLTYSIALGSLMTSLLLLLYVSVIVLNN